MLGHYRQRENQEKAKLGALRHALQFGLSVVYTMFTAMSAHAETAISAGPIFSSLFKTWLTYPLMSLAVLGDIIGFRAALSAWRNASNRHYALWRDLFIESLKLAIVGCAVILPFLGELIAQIGGIFSSFEKLSFFTPFATPLFVIALSITWLQQACFFGYYVYKFFQLRDEDADEKDENDPAFKEYQAVKARLFMHFKLVVILGLTIVSIILSAGLLGAAPAAIILGFCIATAALIGLDVGHSTKGPMLTRCLAGGFFTAGAVLSTLYLPNIALFVVATLGMSMPAALCIVLGIALLVFGIKAILNYHSTKVDLKDEVEMVVVKPNLHVESPTSTQPSHVSSAQRVNGNAQVSPTRTTSALYIQENPAKTVKNWLENGAKDKTKAYLLTALTNKRDVLVAQYQPAHYKALMSGSSMNETEQTWGDKILVLNRYIDIVNDPHLYADKTKNAAISEKAKRAFDGFTSPKGCETERLASGVEMYAKHCITPQPPASSVTPALSVAAPTT